MFFLLSKLIPPFLDPPGATLLMALAAALVWRWRPRAAVAVLAAALVHLYLLSTPIVSGMLGATLERRYPPLPIESVPQADAAVLLGGVLHIPSPARPSVELTESSDRLWMGVRLYRAGKAPLLIVSGSNIPLFGENGMSEARAARALLRDWGVPEEAILMEERARNTFENATFSKPLLEARGARRVLLVTSATHMARSVAIFRRAGMEVIPVPTDYLTGWMDPNPLMGLIPDAKALALSGVATHEWMGLLVYRLRGWS